MNRQKVFFGQKPEAAGTMVGILHVLNDGFLASFPLLLPFVQKELGLGFASIGFLSGLLGSAGVLLALPSGALAARFGGLRVLAAAMLFYSFAFVLAGFSPGFPVLVIAFAVASVGFGVFHPISFALVAHGSTPKDIGRKMGNFTAIGDIGKIGVSSVMTLLVVSLGWRSTSVLYGIIPFIFLCAMLLVFRPHFLPGNPSGAKGRPKPHGLRYRRDFILAVVTGSLDALASSSLFIFIPFLFLFRGIPPAILGSLSGAFFVGNMLGKVAFGKIVDRFGSLRIFIASELLMAVLLVLISLQTSVALIAVLAVLLGAVTKGTVPVINTMVANSVPDPELYEKAFGVVSFTGGIAGVAAPFALGLAAERFGVVPVFQLSAAFAVLAVVPVSVNRLFSGSR